MQPVNTFSFWELLNLKQKAATILDRGFPSELGCFQSYFRIYWKPIQHACGFVIIRGLFPVNPKTNKKNSVESHPKGLFTGVMLPIYYFIKFAKKKYQSYFTHSGGQQFFASTPCESHNFIFPPT